jgi:hypothetical protein
MHRYGRHDECCCRDRVHEYGFGHRHHAQDCCCGVHESRHHRHHYHRTGEHWHAGHGFYRRFATRSERLAEMEAYLRDLQAEVKAVEEGIAELKASP